METKELARLVLLLVAVLRAKGILHPDGGDPGSEEVIKEIDALVQVHSERTRIATTQPYHLTSRGAAALERANQDVD